MQARETYPIREGIDAALSLFMTQSETSEYLKKRFTRRIKSEYIIGKFRNRIPKAGRRF